MMRNTRIIIGVLVVACLVGCHTTTEESRRDAAALALSVDRYVENRATAIDRINADYRASYAMLAERHRRLEADALRLEMRADARRMADQMLQNWQSRTTFTAVAEELAASRDRHVALIAQREATLAAARSSYAAAYADLEGGLRKLRDSKSDIESLAQSEKGWSATIRFVGMLVDAYRTAHDDEGTD